MNLFDIVAPLTIEEAKTDYQKRRQRERDVDAGKPVSRQAKNPQTDYAKKRAKEKKELELGEAGGGWGLDPKTRLELKKRRERQKIIAKWAGVPLDKNNEPDKKNELDVKEDSWHGDGNAWSSEHDQWTKESAEPVTELKIDPRKAKPGQTQDEKYKGWNLRYQMRPATGSKEYKGRADNLQSQKTQPIGPISAASAEELLQQLKDAIDSSRGSNAITTGRVTIFFNANLAKEVIGHGGDIYADIEQHGDTPLLLLSTEDQGGMIRAQDRSSVAVKGRDGHIGAQAFAFPADKAKAAGLTLARYALGQPINYAPGITAIPLEFRNEVYPGETVRMDEPGLTVSPPKMGQTMGEDGMIGPDSTSPVGGHVDEAKLNVGDPIIVTAPNEFEGKTGEISEFSPSGKFVIVNLYNHGKHSMHLSDVGYNQYADEEDDLDEDAGPSPVAGAITRRILQQRLDLLKQYGPELVGAAVDNVADYVGDVEEIGSSDVSAWVAQVERMLKENPPEAFAEGWSDAIVAQRTGQPRTPYSVYIKGKKWKDFENEDHAEAVANKLRAKFKADGRDPSVITIAATDYDKGVEEGAGTGEYSRILQAFKIYINTMGDGMEFYNWANRPEALKVLAQKAGTTPEKVKQALESLNWGQKPDNRWDDKEDGPAQQGVAEGAGQQLSVQQLATVSDAALDSAYHYGRSQPGNTFGWQANLKSAAFAKQMIDRGVTDIEQISDAIHKGWNVTAQAFVKNPMMFDDSKTMAPEKLQAKIAQRQKLMTQQYAQLPEDEKEKDRVVARAMLQAITGGQQSVAEDTGSWIVYDPKTKQIKKRFKTHTAGKSYAQTHGLGFASSEYYFDRVKEKAVAETSLEKLARYKKAAGADATAADKRGDFERGNKRFKGIVRATNKEFDKSQAQGVAETTGDEKFDKMLKGITGKKAVAKQQKTDTKQQASNAFGSMFGGGNPADKLSIKKKGVAEGFPQPGESSGKAKQFDPNAKVQTKEMTLDQILATVKGIPYVNNVVDDWDAKDYSWGVTKKVIEYAQYLQKNPQSVANLPPLVVIDGQLNDGAHRLSAINLLQKRMDPKNPLWKQVKLKVNFGTSADVASEQGAAEVYTPAPSKPFRNPKGFNKQGTGVGNKLAQLSRDEIRTKIKNDIVASKFDAKSVKESYWTKLQDERNTKIASLIDELKESIKK